MADPKINIIIGAITDAATKGIDQVEGELKSLGNTAKETGKSSSALDKVKGAIAAIGIAAGIATTVAVALKKALDMGREGAAAKQTAESFDLLLKVVGAAPGLLDKLKAASNGTISELDLMSSTSALLAGAQGELAKSLANATPKLLEIAKAANKLNPALGSTTHQYESLALGIKRASPMILDNLGLTIKVGQANETYAESIGKTVEQLTAEEQKQALLNEVLRAGDVLIDQVGGTTDSATDSYDQMTVAIDEAWMAIKMGLVPATTTLAEAITKELTAQDRLAASIKNTTGTYEEYIARIEEATPKAYGHLAAVQKQAIAQDTLTEAQFNAKLKSDALAAAMTGAEMRGRGYTGMVVEATDETDQLAQAQKDLQADMTELKIFMSTTMSDELESHRKKQLNIKLAMMENEEQIKILNGMEQLTDEQRGQLDELLLKQDELQAEYEENARVHDEASKKILFNLLEQAAAVGGLSQTEGEALAAVAESWGLVDETQKNAFLSALEWMNGLQEGVPVTTKMVNDLKLAMDGLESKEISIDVWYKEHGTIPGISPTIGGGGKKSNPNMKAEGGPVSANTPYIVGERGPEWFVPQMSGTIIPNNKIPNAATTTTNRLTVYGGLHLSGVESGADLLWQLNDMMIG